MESLEDNSLENQNSFQSNRGKLVDTAIQFLLNPKVQSSDDKHKKAFLLKKGLTEKEVDEALSRSRTAISPKSEPNEHAKNRTHPWRQIFIYSGFAGLAAAMYGIYKFIKSFLVPQWVEQRRAMEKLQLSIDQLNNTLSKVERAMQNIVSDQETQKYIRNRAQDEIKSEFSSLKGILLNKNQFPVAPTASPIIPAWQMETSTASQAISDIVEVSADQVEDVEESDSRT